MGSLDFWSSGSSSKQCESEQSLSALAEVDSSHFSFCSENRNKIQVRRYETNKFEFYLNDRKLVFLYYTFCTGIGNVESLKKSLNYHGVVITHADLDTIKRKVNGNKELCKEYNRPYFDFFHKDMPHPGEVTKKTVRSSVLWLMGKRRAAVRHALGKD
jgi:hypothetical protein